MSRKPKNPYIDAVQKGVRLGNDINARKKVIAERLKITRIKAGLKQKDIAEKADIHATTYSGYENSVGSISTEVLIRIADIYHVSLDYLTGRTENLYGIEPPENTDNITVPTNDELLKRIEKLEQMINQETPNN